MKMEHAIRAPYAGTVASVGVVIGQQVETGTVLVVVDAAPPDVEGTVT
jgi:propionyl-CoA carboxylase alpha chain